MQFYTIFYSYGLADLDLLIAPCPNDNEIDAEAQRLNELGIPTNLHQFKWLYENCNQLTQQNREKIVSFMTGQYSQDGVEKEDILLNRTVDAEKGVTKDSVFRMMFASKKWKKVVLSRRVKNKAVAAEK